MGLGELIQAGLLLLGALLGGVAVETLRKGKWKREGRQEAADEAARDTLERVQHGIDAQIDGSTSGRTPDERVRKAFDEFK